MPLELLSFLEGPGVSSAQYLRLVDKLNTRLSALGLAQMQFVGPDTASLSAGVQQYMPAMLANPALMAKVPGFALHSYGGGDTSPAQAISSSAYPNVSYWLTEFSGPCGGCDNGAPPPGAWSFARDTFSNAISHLESGANALFLYDAYDSYYEHHGSMGYWGALAIDAVAKTYAPRKRMYALAQVYRFVRPGARRVAITNAPAGVRALGFSNADGSLTIVGINDNGSPVTINGTLANVPGSQLPAAMASYTTSPSTDLLRGTDVAVSNGRFSTQVPGQTIFALTNRP